MSVHGDFKTNTAPSPTYPYLVPALSEGVAVSTATAPNTTTQQIVPYFTTGFSGAPTVTRSSGGATMTIAVPNAVVTNTSVNNTVTYTYQYSFDGTTWYGNTNTAPIGASAWTVNAGTAPFTSAAASYTVYVRCVTNSNGLTTPNISATSVGVPSLPTTISAAEDTNQSRQVRISWTPGSDNGSALTNQTLVWSPNSDLSGATSTTITPGTNYYDIASNRSTGALLPNKTYYYKLTMSNAVGDNGTSVYSFTTRSSTPKISTTVNGLPTTRSTLKVMTAGGMVSAQARVFDGTTWQYLK
jgi:hypothetical protein